MSQREDVLLRIRYKINLSGVFNVGKDKGKSTSFCSN